MELNSIQFVVMLLLPEHLLTAPVVFFKFSFELIFSLCQFNLIITVTFSYCCSSTLVLLKQYGSRSKF